MNWRSMRARATLGFVAAVALLLLLTGAGLLEFARHERRQQVKTLLSTTASSIQEELDAEARDHSSPPLSAQSVIEDDTFLKRDQLVVLVYDRAGKLLAHSSDQPISLADKHQWMTTTLRDGNRLIVVAYAWGATDREWKRLAWSLAAAALIVLMAVAAGAWYLVGRVLSPIDHLAELARTSPVDAARLQSPSEDAEVQRLVGTLNDFLERLRASNRAKERFYAAASHELRTPLQGLAGFLEIGLARPREREELVEILREAQDQSQRLVKLTADLLALNQLENNADAAKMECGDIDVADVVERALAPLATVRRERNLRLTIDLPSGAEAEIVAPWSHVEMLVRNLVENAHKYAPDGGRIQVAWRDGTLCVWNTVAWSRSDRATVEKKLERFFEPFYRLDASREGQVTGNGLGLAICHAVCQANNWPITLSTTDAPEQGLEVRIEFAPPSSAARPEERIESRAEFNARPVLVE